MSVTIKTEYDCIPGDFEDLVGSPIPYQEHGFQSLDLFLRSIPDTVRVRARFGNHFLSSHAVPWQLAGNL